MIRLWEPAVRIDRVTVTGDVASKVVISENDVQFRICKVCKVDWETHDENCPLPNLIDKAWMYDDLLR